MIADLALRLVVTVAFSASSLYCVVRLVRRGSIPARGTYAAHLLMGAAMILMAWPAGIGLWIRPQLVLFGAATLWFLVLAVSFGRVWVRGSHDELHGRLVYWYHAIMMAAMVWMLAVMDGVGAPGAAASAHGGHGDHGGAAMAGMAMAGGQNPVAITVAAWVLGLLFSVATLVWLGQLVPEGPARRDARALRRRVGPEIGYETLMGVGMAIMSFAFL